MCGIFGLLAQQSCKLSAEQLSGLARTLFKFAETRGKDAAGVLAVNESQILTYKEARRASLMIKSPGFQDVIRFAEQSYQTHQIYVIAGHTRMVTNGSENDPDNNQPYIKDGLVLLHNGIIVNEKELWEKNQELQHLHQVDTEIFSSLVSAGLNKHHNIEQAMQQAFCETDGANTIAALHANHDEMFLGTTNGSLYFWTDSTLGISVFASEAYILNQSLQSIGESVSVESSVISQVKPESLLAISLLTAESRLLQEGALPEAKAEQKNLRKIEQLQYPKILKKRPDFTEQNTDANISKQMHVDQEAIDNMIRCNQCLLPETFPFISFDQQGVCQFCRQYDPPKLLGVAALQELAEKIKSEHREASCLVPISGGRDSSYGLHYVKQELGLNPVAYTYDWGFVTDLARRNISRMCGQLNVEHILVAADIKQKQENVRKNVIAWLNKPQLSLIPLFMAGDKAFFYYASMIKKQMQLGPILFSMNWLERTGFKTGFAGVNDTVNHEKTHGLTPANQFKLLSHYGKSLLANPQYINLSIPDTLFGFFSFYMRNKDYYSIFDYLTWDESEIESCLIDGYNWETAPDTKSTWRIGDGTAPFYNYIYLTVAGFSEHDTFRSNQIREGMIDRSTALQLIKEENQVRVESFKWYCDTIGIDAIEALKIINSIPKLYRQS